jgi:hypothetical protein
MNDTIEQAKSALCDARKQFDAGLVAAVQFVGNGVAGINLLVKEGNSQASVVLDTGKVGERRERRDFDQRDASQPRPPFPAGTRRAGPGALQDVRGPGLFGADRWGGIIHPCMGAHAWACMRAAPAVQCASTHVHTCVHACA